MYKTRFRRWGLWKHDSSAKTITVISPQAWKDEERVYLSIRDYYDGAFASQRWTFAKPDMVSTTQDEHELAVQRTKHAMRNDDEMCLRFRAAICLLEKGRQSPNGTCHADDLAQAVRLLRISFAALSQSLLGPGLEAPMLPLLILYIIVRFSESTTADFSALAAQLLKYLRGLTSSPSSQHIHPTALLWRALCAHHLNPQATSDKNRFSSRSQLNTCAAIAVDRVSHHIGPLHSWTVELTCFAIAVVHPKGTGPVDDKSSRFRSLLRDLETETDGVYDTRHIDTLCCWASHLRDHGQGCSSSSSAILGQGQGQQIGQVDPVSLHRGISLLEGVLYNPSHQKVLQEYPEGLFNMYSFLTQMNLTLKRWSVAEGYIRRAKMLAEQQRIHTGNMSDGDLFESLSSLEAVLRAQGKNEEADEVREERAALVKETLELVGEGRTPLDLMFDVIKGSS